MTPKEFTKEDLLCYLQTDPVVLAAVINSVNRFYMDNWNPEKGIEMPQISMIYSNLWCTMPNWRKVLQDAGKRYFPNASNTNAIPLYSKPTPRIELTINLDFKLQQP